jgi:CHAT domain-containing protein
VANSPDNEALSVVSESRARLDLTRMVISIVSVACIGAIGLGCNPAVAPRYGFDTEDFNRAVTRGEGRQALDFYEREGETAAARGDRLRAAHAFARVGSMAWRLGEYERGLRAASRGLAILGDDASAAAAGRRLDLLDEMATQYRYMGNGAEAERYWGDGLKLATAAGNQYWQAAFLRQLGSVALSSGRRGVAVKRLSEAVAILENLVGRENVRGRTPDPAPRVELVRSLVTLATLQAPPQARPSLRRALALAGELGYADEKLRALSGLGEIALRVGELDEAEARYGEAVRIATSANVAAWLPWLHAGLGQVHAARRRFESALAEYQRALDVIETTRGRLQHPDARGQFIEDKQSIYQAAVIAALGSGRPAEAFALAERSRARAFLDMLGARIGGSDVSAPAMNARQASLITVKPATVDDIQRLLRPDSVLIEYFVGDRETIAWIVTVRSLEVVRLTVGRATLTSATRELRESIADRLPVDKLQNRAERLYRLLYAPLASYVLARNVIIVPHGPLHYLPFTALRNPEGRWLVEDLAIVTVPSASVLSQLEAKRRGPPGDALVLGNPTTTKGPPLPFAENEARMVGAHFAHSTVLLRGEATKSRFRALSPQASVIHLATHAEFLEEDPLATAILLATDGGDDGRLTVREIFDLKLSTQLVVLSACETGLGKLSRGDELVGLQRAFLYAGARTVLTSLWKVGDRATFDLMRGLYERFGQMPLANALADAQRAALRQSPHSFEWAAFTITGLAD